jgi:Protein of unknown function (DUF3987)
MKLFDNIPAELRALPQWVNWRIGVRGGKKTKIPLNPRTLRKASVDNSETWTSFEVAKKNCRNGTGIGFVFTEKDPYEGNDFDKCIDPETGDIEPWAQKLISEFNSYSEKSQSGGGVHVILKCKLPPGGRKVGRIECYDAGRFFAFTGDTLNVSEEIKEVDGAKLHRDLMSEARDLNIVDKAMLAKNGEAFKKLWHGDIAGYPSHSEADMALCGHLYFWTQDKKATDRLFRKWVRFRDKFDEKHFSDGRTYGEAILDKVSQSEEKVNVTETEWPDPIPFDSFSSLPDFPIEALPDIGREFVEAVATVNQVDLGLPASIYLGALSVCAAKKIEIDLRTHKEPANLYLCPIMDSGQRKTSTMSVMTAPIYEYEKTLAANMREGILKSRNRYAINEEKLKKLRRLAATEREAALRDQYRREADDILKEMDENPPLEDPQLIADDITSEKTAEVMADNGERLGIFSAEGDLFANMAGRYNDKGGNFVIYLKGHPGDDVRVNRIARKARHMSSPALTMCLTVQRDVIDEIGKNKQFKGRGLLARFNYSLCKSQVGYRARQEATIPNHLIEKYRNHILTVAEAPLFLRTLPLTSEAQTLWNEFYNDIEMAMKPGGELQYLSDWSSKLPGAVARIAGLLHFAKHGQEVGSHLNEPLTVASACAIGAYYREHAMAVFGLMREDVRIESAKRILEYIQQQKPRSFKGRDILRNKNFFKTMDDITPGIKVLSERGYVRELSQKQQKAGRPEASEYEVNPSISNI